MSEQNYDLEERLLDFAARIIRFSEAMRDSQAGRHVANQVLRSGTSPMAHHGEAQAAESRKDFIHKMKIALKELRETIRWIKLAQRSQLIEKPDLADPLRDEADQLIRIFAKSISTAEDKL
jgi:four helix bundle protein